MGFKLPKYLENYLSDAKWRKPFESFVNNGNYYTGINYFWVTYLSNVVRPCIAYSTGVVDGTCNNALSLSTGKALVDGATRLVRGNKIFFEGNDLSCNFLSDIWAPQTNFNKFLSKLFNFVLAGGTSVIKINTDIKGRNKLSPVRIDRSLFSVNEDGDISECVFYITAFNAISNKDGDDNYWLVEHRYFDKDFNPCVKYKVFKKSGVANAQVLPSPFSNGIGYEYLPRAIKRELINFGVRKLNVDIRLPYHDGLGVWGVTRTAVNSAVPDVALGDPLLYGVLDLLWSMDIVFSGSLVDVLNGEGKVLVPKQFLGDITKRLKSMFPGQNINIATEELDGGGDDSFVYLKTDIFDKDKQSPTLVQFDIRADQYGAMLDMYAKEAAVRCGFSPTSIFPHLTPDNSAKTATEVTAEENLTRASVKEFHDIVLPVINRALREVLIQEGFPPDVSLKLSDYIGNKIQFDANLRENYRAGLVPKEVAVQQINNLNNAETKEYLRKLEEDANNGGGMFNDNNYYGDMNGDSKGQFEPSGTFNRGSGE